MRKLKFLFLVLVGSVFMMGCATSLNTDPKYVVKNPYLFEIRKDNQLRGYLFGTVHSGVDMGDLPNSFWPIFDKHDVLVTEIDTEKKRDSSEDWKLMMKGPKDVSVNFKLKPEVFEKVKKLLVKEMGPARTDFVLKNANLYGIYQLVTEIQLKNQTILGSHGEIVRMNSKFMLDKGLQSRAKSQGKIMSYLDADILQIIFKCIAENESKLEASIEKRVSSQTSAQEEFDLFKRILANYREGGETFRKFLESDISDELENDQCLLSPRNEKWAASFDQLFEAYSLPFIAVGAAHLEIGPRSLRKILSEKGFETVPVELDKIKSSN